jgi:uncharacterized protein YndB with AHSA1/START domain
MTFDPGPLADASRRPDGDRWTLVFIRSLRHPPEKVWAALTAKDALARWAPFEAARDLDATGDVTLTMIDGAHREDMTANVITVDRPRLLEYTWGADLLRWQLTPTTDGTRLTLSHTMDDRDFASKVAAGWHLCLLVASRWLDGAPIGPIRGHDAMNFGWQELADAYEKEFDD